MIRDLRRRAPELSASELLDALVAALGLVFAPGSTTRPYLDTFADFVRKWEQKSFTESRAVRDFVEYLHLFEEAGGLVALPESPVEDAVQLMTAHAAKGLEFDHVFILRLSRGSFPTWPRPHVFEFPPELMKEELPQGDFHIQEERRLFYVAMTRAQRRLTLTTVTGRTRPSPFLDDFLEDKAMVRSDVRRLAPPAVPSAVPEPPPVEQLDFTAKLFHGLDAPLRTGSRITSWAGGYCPPPPVPLQLSPTAVDTYGTCPLKFHFRYGWKIRGRAHAAMTFGNVMHSTVKFIVAQIAQHGRVAWEEVERAFDREWRSSGYEDDYQEQEYRREGLAQLRVFHSEYSAAPADVLAQERPFELPLEGDVVLTGRMDQVNRLNGGVEIVDYKTGRPRDEKSVRKNLQLSVYAMAAREVLEQTPTRLTFYNLTTNSPVSSARSEKDLQKARAQIAEAADNIRAGEFPAKPGFHCRFCDYKPICPAYEAAGAPED
jgi:DNA helicase-2/ATP-dependent DNA helicase PcrA